MSLLKAAKGVKAARRDNSVTDEEKQFVLAFLQGDISLIQASKAFCEDRGVTHGMGVYTLIARCAKALVQDGTLSVNRK